MSVYSPLLQLRENKGPQFVCAPGIERATGQAQAEAAVEGVQDLGVFENVVGITYDTTPSNSSVSVGTAALIEEERGVQLVKAPCRRHIWDLIGKNLRKVFLGRNIGGPGHPLFLRLCKEWPNIVDNIDYTNLATLDMAPWEGTFVEELVDELKLWCISELASATFDRGSYKDLLLTLIAFLEAPTPPNFRFRIKKPKPVSNARYGEVAQYYLDLALLSRQLPWQLTAEQREEVQTLSFISAVFYAPGFLRSPLGSDAAFNDLTSIIHFRQLRPFMPALAREALQTWERHLDYITPQLVILALVCEKFSFEQKNRLARELLSLLPSRVRVLPPTPVSPPGPNFTLGDTFLPVDNTMPDLSRLATGNSFLLFNICDIPDEDLKDWLSSPAERWSSDPNSPDFCHGFAMFKSSTDNWPFVNDAAERCYLRLC